MNAQYHLFQEVTNLFTVAIVSDKTNHKIQEMIDIPEMIEVHVIHQDENLAEIILDLESHEMINF